MSQPVGLNFKSRIPELQDDASIEEALRVYHYGVDNYSTQEIPNDSIEGNFRSLDDRVSVIESTGTISVLKPFFIEAESETASPNVITPESSSTVPLTIRGASGQTENLQQWQNSASADVSVVFSDGSFSTSAYISAGNVNKSSSTAIYAQTINKNHKGIVVKGASLQAANLQEWQDSSASVLAKVDSSGVMYSNGLEVVNISEIQSLTNKSITIPSGETLEDFKARNFQISASTPSGGNDGDLWIQYN